MANIKIKEHSTKMVILVPIVTGSNTIEKALEQIKSEMMEMCELNGVLQLRISLNIEALDKSNIDAN